MAKGNLFLGFGRGKVGDVVFSRQDGEQVTRARNRSPRNPQTPLMMLQRVVMKTTSCAFSLMQDICNHSFQGIEGVTPNQSEFVRANVRKFREQLADIINSGDPESILTSSETNFSERNARLAPVNPYIISAGTIPSLASQWVGSESSLAGGWLAISGVEPSGTDEAPVLSYKSLIEALGLQKGDQITIVYATVDDTEEGADGLFNGFVYGRFILEPSDGNMEGNVFDDTKWNPKNENCEPVYLEQPSPNAAKFGFAPLNYTNICAKGKSNTAAAASYIVSRVVGDVWRRSSESLVLRPTTVGTMWHLAWDTQINLLSDAIASYMADTSSLLYLNQAEE